MKENSLVTAHSSSIKFKWPKLFFYLYWWESSMIALHYSHATKFLNGNPLHISNLLTLKPVVQRSK